MKKSLLIIFFFVFMIDLSAKEQGFIDIVESFTPGEGQNTGQADEYFPANIFGPPDTNASGNTPSQVPEEILSLGLDGEIVIGFEDHLIVDGPGADFTIFENAFVNPINQKIFAEPAVVSVSIDGEEFIEFPYDEASLEGCAGTKPTNGNADPFDPGQSGGNSFDLAEIGLQKIKWIKIRDITRAVLENPDHEYYDPTLTGFDLDAVAGIHLEKNGMMSIINPAEVCFNIKLNGNLLTIENLNNIRSSLHIIDITGRLLYSDKISSNTYISLNYKDVGVYFLILKNDNFIIRKKLLLNP